jgi:hypothetical protein
MTKAEASRTNGSKSNGPVTQTGKAASARNAQTHGLTGTTVVLAHESRAEYDALLASFTERFRPDDEMERDLIREAVNARWRLRRIEAMESALVQKSIDDRMAQLEEGMDPELAYVLAYAELAENSKGLRLLNRYARELRRSYEKAMSEYAGIHVDDDAVPTRDDSDDEGSYQAFRMAMDAATFPSGSFRQSTPDVAPAARAEHQPARNAA